MAYRCPKCRGCLAGQGPPELFIRDRAGDHHGKTIADFMKVTFRRIDRRFAVQRIKNCFDRNMSAPPSSRPTIASSYESTNSSNVTLRKPGLFASGEIEAVLFVGPRRLRQSAAVGRVGFDPIGSPLAISAETRLIS